MNHDGRAGAASAAEFYFTVQRYAYVTGDVDPIHALSSPECRRCAFAMSEIEEFHRLGRIAVIGEPVPVGDHGVVEHGPGSWMVALHHKTGGYEIIDDRGEVDEVFPGGKDNILWVVVAHDGEDWLVYDYGGL